jgi:hypothetical protein
MAHKLDAIRALYKGQYHKATEDKIDWKDGHTTTDAENTQITNEYNRLVALENYQEPRRKSYKTIPDQLDQLYHDMVAGKLDSTGEWAKSIKAVKDANPKE